MTDKLKISRTIVDPPSGWQFGFPQVFDFQATSKETHDEELHAWFVSKGYPQALIDQGMLKYCRYWEKNIDVDFDDNAG